MTVKELADELKLDVISGHDGLNHIIAGGYTSDLLSDVMGNAKEGQVWITLQTHKNVMAIASIKEIAAIILVKDNKPDKDTCLQSDEENIPVLSTYLPAFEIGGKIYNLLNQ